MTNYQNNLVKKNYKKKRRIKFN